MTATKILFVIVLATIGIFLIVKGGITSLSQTKGRASED